MCGVDASGSEVKNEITPMKYVIPAYSVVLSWTPPSKSVHHRRWAASEKARREGEVPLVFSNADGINFTGAAGEKLAEKYKLRFYGISHDGVQDGALALSNPVAAGRLSVIVGGLTTVCNHLRYMNGIVPGDFVEVVMVRGCARECECARVCTA